jgi:Flavodoxin-like fold
VENHTAADLVILQTPLNWFSAPWIYRNTWARSSMSALPDFGVFDIFKNPDIPLALEDYKRHLEKHCLLASRIANIA